MITLLGIFYATMVLAGYIVEFLFTGLGLVPTERTAKVTEAAIQWNYTTVLNIIFLLIAAALLVRFFRTGGPAMMRMMGGGPGEHEQHAHGEHAHEQHAHDQHAHDQHAHGEHVPGGPAHGTPAHPAHSTTDP